MAAKFCFKYVTGYINGSRNCTGSFLSEDGEEYTVKFVYYDYCSADLTIEWNKVSSKFIKVTGYYENNNNRPFVTQTSFVKDKTSVTMINIPSNYSGVIIIEVVSCIDVMQHDTLAAKSVVKSITPKKKEPVVEKKLEELSTDMRKLLQTGNLSDVTLTDGSKEIHAHKLILSTRSSVFAKMFQHPMKESRENRITIKDIPNEVLSQLLHFMYAGTVVLKDSAMARALYIAADKYDVKDLRGICSLMLKSVDLNSVLDTLLLADLYSDKQLKEAALSFISKNYSQVKALQDWSTFMKEHQNLAIEILSFVVDKKV